MKRDFEEAMLIFFRIYLFIVYFAFTSVAIFRVFKAAFRAVVGALLD